MRRRINRCVESSEQDLQRKAIRRRQLWKGFDHTAIVTRMGEHPYSDKSGGVPTMGGQAGPVVVAEGGMIAISEWIVLVVVAMAAVG